MSLNICRLLSLLALVLTPVASAQVAVTLRPPTTPIFAGQYPDLTLTVRNGGKTPVTVGNVLKDGRMPCPTFKVFDRAGGPPLTFPGPLIDCLVGERVTLAAGQKAVYKGQLSIPLQPGEYTVVMTVPTVPKARYVQTTLRVGPGPFVAELRVPTPVRAGAPLPLEVAFHNIWRTTQQKDLRLCRHGLLIRNENGQAVYDNRPEHGACTADLQLSTISPGDVHVEKWFPPLPKLPPGSYTAVLWGEYNASARFQVRK